MPKEEISYVPLSNDLSHPADRRRILVWANAHGIKLRLNQPIKGKLLVLSSLANFRYWMKRHKGPVAIDLVDSYLGYSVSIKEDLFRNTMKVFLGQSSPRYFKFTTFLASAIGQANLVIVASAEQAETIRHINPNVHIILDDLSELKASRIGNTVRNGKSLTLLWEGQGVNLKHLLYYKKEIGSYLEQTQSKLIVVTNLRYASIGSKLMKLDAEKELKKGFGQNFKYIELRAWSINSLEDSARKSDLAIIPIIPSDKFANAKPENKLLSHWKLRLPVLCSPVNSYLRTMASYNIDNCIVESHDWVARLNRVSEEIGNLKREIEKIYPQLEENLERKKSVEKWDRALFPLM